MLGQAESALESRLACHLRRKDQLYPVTDSPQRFFDATPATSTNPTSTTQMEEHAHGSLELPQVG